MDSAEKTMNSQPNKEKPQDIIANRQEELAVSFQQYVEAEWLKHFGDRRSHNQNVLIISKTSTNG